MKIESSQQGDYMVTSPAQVLTEVNNRLYDQNPSQLFVTIFYAVVDLKTGTLTYCNGGHDAPYLVTADGVVHALDPTGDMGLGVTNGIPFHERSLSLKRGDTLYLFTDGFAEAYNGDNEMFGESRLRSGLVDSHTQPVDGVIGRIVTDVEDFVGGGEQSDDLTCLGFRLKFNVAQESSRTALQTPSPEPANAVLDLSIENDIHLIPALQGNIRAFCADWSIPDRLQFQINLCVEEHLVNLISYAYKDNESHTIAVCLRRQPDQMHIEITDDSALFNPLSVPPPVIAETLADQEVGGHGISLIRAYMDEIGYETGAGRNRFCMIKNLRQTND